jgi:hypothetical protein
MRRIAIAAAALAVAAAPAAAAEERPPIEHDTKCSIKTPKAFELGDVLKRGFPATIACDGPARVTADVEIDEHSRKVADYIAERYSDGYPGVPARYPYRELAHRFEGAGTAKVRIKLFRYARPILKRFAPFPVEVNLSIETADGKWWTLKSLKRPLRR